MANTTKSTLDNQLSGYYVDKALMTLINDTPLYQHAMKTPLKGGKGDTTYWNAWNRLGGASSTLTEAGSNTAVALSSRRVSAQIQQWGRGIVLSDLAEYMTVLAAREGAQQRLRDSAKETQEFILHTAIFKPTYYNSQSTTGILSSLMSSVASGMSDVTGTNSNSNELFAYPCIFAASTGRLSAVSATAPTVSAKASLYAIRKSARKLRVNNAKPFADGKFIGYCHTNFHHILKSDPAFLAWNQSQFAGQTMHVGEVFQTDGVRWISTNVCPRYAVAAHSVNITFIFGQEAFGITEALGGLQMYLVTGADHTNPYATYSQLTYKVTAAAATLNPSAGVLLFTEEKL